MRQTMDVKLEEFKRSYVAEKEKGKNQSASSKDEPCTIL